MTPKQRIDSAAGVLEALQRELQDANSKVESLKSQINDARFALQEARIAADAHLPRATVITHSRWIRNSESRTEVVVVKRTERSATVRKPGFESTTQYRPGKHSGQWRVYPAPKNRFTDTWTELVFEAKEA